MLVGGGWVGYLRAVAADADFAAAFEEELPIVAEEVYTYGWFVNGNRTE